jgi:hypothetical protein
MAYRYPQNDFDKADLLLNILGSFWATTYQGNKLLADLTEVTGQVAQQTYVQLMELVNSISRFNVPLFHQDNWYALKFRETDLNLNVLPKYNTQTTHTYIADNSLTYGQNLATSYFVLAKPRGLTEVKLIFNRLTSPTVELVQGVDYWLEDTTIVFRENPFKNNLIAKRDLLNNLGEIVDKEIVLWVYRGKWEWYTIYKQFGYVLRLQLKSSENYKQFINAIFDAFVSGTSIRTQQLALAAAFGVPLVIEAKETVEKIVRDADKLNIITDQHAYRFPLSAVPLVQEQQQVMAGDSLTDLLQIFEFTQGKQIDPQDIPALSVGIGLLPYGFQSELVFENIETPVIVEPEVNGFTKISWKLGGFPFDADKFWDEVHLAGVAKNQTIAMLLDQRKIRTGQPTAAVLPSKVNPLQFLADNILRNNAYLVKIKAGILRTDRLSFVPSDQLRKIQPPHTLMLLNVELVYDDTHVIMETLGTEATTGYEEALSSFPCTVYEESITPTLYMAEQVRATRIGGRCV